MRKILYIILALTVLCMSAGCETAEERKRISRAEKEHLRKEDSAALKISIMPTEDCLPLVVAKELRLYDTLGVDVHLKRCHALSECRHALEGSEVEGAAIDSTLMALMNKDEAWLYSGLKTNLSWQFLTAKKARISRLDQMTDKIVGADRYGESRRLAELAIDSLQRKNTMVFIVQVEDPRVRLDMLQSGNIDAALLPEPFATKARNSGARVIERVKSKPVGVVAFRKKAMKDETRKKQFEAFVKAVGIAKDSIAKYGKDKYTRLLEW